MEPLLRIGQTNLMPLAATVVVVFYAAGVLLQPAPAWWEYLVAAAGAAFCIWFWITELQRARRRADREKKP